MLLLTVIINNVLILVHSFDANVYGVSNWQNFGIEELLCSVCISCS